MTYLKAEKNHSVPTFYGTRVFIKTDKVRDVSSPYQVRRIKSLFNQNFKSYGNNQTKVS